MHILNAVSSESTQSVGHLEYFGKFDFIFETNSGYESGDQMVFFTKKYEIKISCRCTFKHVQQPWFNTAQNIQIK
jgi:hypothetical protein